MSDCKYDKKIIHGSESDKKALVSLILKVMEDKSPKHLKVTSKEISQAISEGGQTHPAKLYTNCYGNLANAFKVEDFSYVFKIDEYVVILAPLDVLKDSHKAKKISDEDWALVQKLHESKAANDAEMMKMNPYLFPGN